MLKDKETLAKEKLAKLNGLYLAENIGNDVNKVIYIVDGQEDIKNMQQIKVSSVREEYRILKNFEIYYRQVWSWDKKKDCYKFQAEIYPGEEASLESIMKDYKNDKKYYKYI